MHPARMPHASALTEEGRRLFAGRHAAKRLVWATGWPPSRCQEYMSRRRLLLDAAIELAAREPAFLAALLARVEQVRAQHAATAGSTAVPRPSQTGDPPSHPRPP